MNGRAKLAVRLGNVDPEAAIFCVYLFLAAPAILGLDFCVRHIEVTRPKRKWNQLDSGTKVPFLRHPGNRAASRAPLSNSLECPSTAGRTSLLGQVTCLVVIWRKSQGLVNTHTERNGLMILDSCACAYNTLAIAVANGVLVVKPNEAILIQLTILGETSKPLKMNQKIGRVQQQSYLIIPTDINVAEIIHIVQEPMDKTTQWQQTSELNNASKITNAVQQTRMLNPLDLPQDPDCYLEKPRIVLGEFDSMWDGHLGKLTVWVIELISS